MKTSLNWLREYVDIPWDAKELSERLTSAGLEVEGIEEKGKIPETVVVAEILTRQPHPDSDHLSICSVRAAEGAEPLQIVCGAPNCDAGKRVPLAMIGTDFGGGFVIKKSKIRNVESFGMMCSAKELGISEDHSGLMILPPDAPLGTPLAKLANLVEQDSVIDWEVTPNRPDWNSHVGIAREIASCSGGQIRLPAADIKTNPGRSINSVASVTNEAPDLCQRYIARVFENVKVGPSPEWMVKRLEAVGLRSINNVVDITNYILLEFGQPLHAFDLRHLQGGQIIVRRAKDGEEITVLDGTKLKLTADNLLIADQAKGVALAGIMGGENSMITDETTAVLLEAATFDRSNIRVSARTLGKSSDSSYLYERGVMPETTALASERAATLLCQLCGATQLDGIIDCYPRPWQAENITCTAEYISTVLGIPVTVKDLSETLVRRGMATVAADEKSLTVSVPFWRIDLHNATDLAEEMAQIKGLACIPELPPTVKVTAPFKNDKYLPQENTMKSLLGLGLDEIMNYSLWSLNACLAGSGLAEENIMRVSNPISIDTAFLRPTLLPGIIQTVNHNVSHNQHDIAIFEIGRVFRQDAEGRHENTHVAIALSGRPHPERFGQELEVRYDFYDLKGILESWLAEIGLPPLQCRPLEAPAYRKGHAAELCLGKQVFATFGEAAPELVKGIRLRSPLFIAQADLEVLTKAAKRTKKYKELPLFPETSRDISFLAPSDLKHQDIVTAIQKQNLPFLEKVELKDIYEDEKVLGAGKRSLMYSLTFRHPQRTLNDDEINELQGKVRAFLQNKLGLELR